MNKPFNESIKTLLYRYKWIFYQRCHRVPLRHIQSPCLPKAFQKCFISLATCVIIIHLRSLSFVLQSLCKKCLTWYFHLKPIMSHYEWYQLRQLNHERWNPISWGIQSGIANILFYNYDTTSYIFLVLRRHINKTLFRLEIDTLQFR